jgi:hypothetical protein
MTGLLAMVSLTLAASSASAAKPVLSVPGGSITHPPIPMTWCDEVEGTAVETDVVQIRADERGTWLQNARSTTVFTATATARSIEYSSAGLVRVRLEGRGRQALVQDRERPCIQSGERRAAPQRRRTRIPHDYRRVHRRAALVHGVGARAGSLRRRRRLRADGCVPAGSLARCCMMRTDANEHRTWRRAIRPESTRVNTGQLESPG